jgi:membrane-associated phospholipid phosphatase
MGFVEMSLHSQDGSLDIIMKLRNLLKNLAPVDITSIVFLLFLVALNIIFAGRVSAWLEICLVNSAVIMCILALAYWAETKKTKLLVGLHRFYSYLIVLFVFKEIYLMVHPIHPVDYDWLFISIDQWMFGVNPTQWMMRFAHPVVTEILQVAYFSYYILFILLGVELYRRYPIEKYDHGAFMIVYGFYLSYLGYFLLPAIGPRFTLHDFYAQPTELPGIFFTSWMRDFVNAGESISFSMANAAEIVQRDVFPSGHTQLTLIVTYLAHLNKIKSRWIISLLAALLIVSTVYLRYHYVIDLIGGCAFFVFTIYSGKWIQRWWEHWVRNDTSASSAGNN